MYIKKEYDFSDLLDARWSGAIDTLKTIEERNKEDELMAHLEEIFESYFDNVPTMTEVNDYLWFDDETIFEALEISEMEEEEDEDYCQKYKCEDCPKNMGCEYALTF